MKKLITALLLIMCLLLCACGKEEAPSGTVKAEVSDEAAQTTQEVVEENVEEYVEKPFAEEMGLKFVAPKAYTVPLTMYSKSPDLNLQLQPKGAKLNAPFISCTLDEEGYVIYSVEQSVICDMEIKYIPPYEAHAVSHGYVFPMFDVYDFYTGLKLVPDIDVVHNEETKENTRIYTVECNGKTADISCKIVQTQVMNTQNYMSGEYRVMDLSPTVISSLTIRAPRDYDGLMLGIAPNVALSAPEDPFAEKEIDDTIHYFGDEDEKVEDYEFIRVSDYVEIPTAGVSATEELN